MVASLMMGAMLPVVLAFATNVNIFEFFMLSYLIAIPFALLLVLATKKQKVFLANLTDPRKLAIITLTGVLTYVSIESGLLYAERFISAALSTVVFRTSPLLMLLLLPTVLKEKLSKSQLAALGLAFIGIFIALGGGQPSSIFSNADLPIILMLLVAALAYALGAVLIKKYVFDMESNMLIFNITLFCLFAVLYAAMGMNAPPLQLPQIGALLFVAIFSNVLSLYMYFTSLRILKTTFVTNFFMLSPFVTLLFASFLLGETIQPYYILIAVLVAVGLVIQRFDKIGGTFLFKKNSKAERFTIFYVTGAFVNTGEVKISKAIQSGGRVLALKLDRNQKGRLDGLIASGEHADVFTDSHKGIVNESDFVKEILGAGEEDMVVMKAGNSDDGETFFEALSTSMDAPDDAKFFK